MSARYITSRATRTAARYTPYRIPYVTPRAKDVVEIIVISDSEDEGCLSEVDNTEIVTESDGEEISATADGDLEATEVDEPENLMELDDHGDEIFLHEAPKDFYDRRFGIPEFVAAEACFRFNGEKIGLGMQDFLEMARCFKFNDFNARLSSNIWHGQGCDECFGAIVLSDFFRNSFLNCVDAIWAKEEPYATNFLQWLPSEVYTGGDDSLKAFLSIKDDREGIFSYHDYYFYDWITDNEGGDDVNNNDAAEYYSVSGLHYYMHKKTVGRRGICIHVK